MQHPRPHEPTAVIFDLDGTLADTLDDITDAMNEVLAEIGRAAVPADRMRGLIGEGLPVLVEHATGIDDPAVIESLVKRYRPVYTKRMLERTRLYPSIGVVLDSLTEAGCKMCVLSNKPDYFAAPMCSALLSRWPFVRCIGHRDGVQRKPAPEAALNLAEAMGHAPEDVYLVGDSAIDMMTAHNAGMKAVAVTWGFRDRENLLAAGPAHLVEQPMELVRLLIDGE